MREYNPPVVQKRIEDTVTSGRGYFPITEEGHFPSPIYPTVFLTQGKLDQICLHDSENLFENNPARQNFVAFVSTHLKDVSPETFAKLYSDCLDYAATGLSLKARAFATEPNVKPHQLEDIDHFFGALAEYLGNNMLGESFTQEAKEAYDRRPKNWKVTNVARLSGQLTARDKKVSLAQITGEELTLKDMGFPSGVGYVVTAGLLAGCGIR